MLRRSVNFEVALISLGNLTVTVTEVVGPYLTLLLQQAVRLCSPSQPVSAVMTGLVPQTKMRETLPAPLQLNYLTTWTAFRAPSALIRLLGRRCRILRIIALLEASLFGAYFALESFGGSSFLPDIAHER
jgi:hypothetical protein